MKKIFTLLCVSVLVFSLQAQELKHCGSTEAQQKVFNEHPEILKQYLEREAELAKLDAEAAKTGYKNANAKTQGTVYVIPVVFHIVHNYGPENISDAQVIDQMRIFNEDLRKLNADTTQIVAAFKSRAADTEIEFRLANIDPDGNCTNGIDRIVSDQTYIGDDGSKLNPWPSDQYLNIWTVAAISSGAAGYAYYPGTAPTGKDGVLMLSYYVGSIGTGDYSRARVFGHETGHCFNLQHVWGNSNNPGVSCGDDGVTDTPVTKGWQSCNLSSNDICTPGVQENVQNFMEYSYCGRMFTLGQKTRMRNSLNSPLGGRNNLWSASNLTTTGVDVTAEVCAPKAEFLANVTSICAGASVTFTDHSWNGDATSWIWTASGPATYNATVQNPTIQFNVPGIYSVTLEASNASGTGTKTIPSYITVKSGTAAYTAPYTEGFESAATTAADWQFISGVGAKWQRTTSGKYAGTASLFLSNSGSGPGDVDEAISTSFDVTGITSPKLYYRTAFAQKNTSNTDILKVYYSKDCGRTWVPRNTKSGSTLATVPAQTSTFIPTSQTQWRLDSIQIPPIYATNNLQIKFEFTGGGGNNIFIDDINIKSPGTITTGIQNINSNGFNFSVFPNPLEDNSTIAFNLAQKENVSIKLVDLIGRTVLEIAAGEYPAGAHSIKLDHNDLKAGIYFVNLSLDKQRYVQKVVVK